VAFLWQPLDHGLDISEDAIVGVRLDVLMETLSILLCLDLELLVKIGSLLRREFHILELHERSLHDLQQPDWIIGVLRAAEISGLLDLANYKELQVVHWMGHISLLAAQPNMFSHWGALPDR
jgi:hypothetical protein